MPGNNRFQCILCFFLFAGLLFVITETRAQLCTGSLGDPAVNITFDAGTNFTPPAAYTYVSSTCPNDGSYTITNFTSGCFGNAWHTVNGDHTGGGSFMLVNASFNPGDFVLTTVTGLCPNTTYEFAAWIMNVLKSPSGIQPNVTFSIETPGGTVLNQFNTGAISVTPSPEWRQYGFFFTTSASNPDIVLRMTNNAPGGNGNDLALDDITFRPCGPVLNSVIVGNPDKLDMCTYDQLNYTFNATVSPGYLSPVFQWQQSLDNGLSWVDIAGATSLTYLRPPTAAGKYLYRLTVAESGNAGITACRINSNVLTINVHARPFVNAGPDRILIKGDSTQLLATITGEKPVYEWSPPDYLNSNTDSMPKAAPPTDMLYTLSAVSAFGCTNEDQVMVKVVNGIYVPSAFSPNNDGKNDTWEIPFLDPQFGATVTVFNRYGQVVYNCTGCTVKWDGNVNGMTQPSGTYVYMISFPNNRRPVMKGTVTLIR